MAGLIIKTNPDTIIDYSGASGAIRFFVLRGVKLYDERDGTSIGGWEDLLNEFVKEEGLDEDDGGGLHAFVYWLKDRALA